MFIFFYLPDNVLGSVAAHIFFLFLTWAFWTAGATSITVALSGELNRKLVTSSYYLPLTPYLPSTQSVFAYPVQLNALEGFAWVNEALVTFTLLFVIIRGILAVRRGNGLRGPLIV
ncbi:hypothetical protein DEU56DRAFT_813866 [Suillus clintonianus]|uniref:uncharacterized protein n=1 Tax=Suillus clintonianus TaxID=1904413 RepID=UPI001B87DA9D|nr:uncharacterized protein DEU56DRAFT_813866 [Suillus clintonianus]KAG2131687.1 hypothetical protein DEU56DRAFT_813866 [Suillus clintonianus]